MQLGVWLGTSESAMELVKLVKLLGTNTVNAVLLYTVLHTRVKKNTHQVEEE